MIEVHPFLLIILFLFMYLAGAMSVIIVTKKRK